MDTFPRRFRSGLDRLTQQRKGIPAAHHLEDAARTTRRLHPQFRTTGRHRWMGQRRAGNLGVFQKRSPPRTLSSLHNARSNARYYERLAEGYQNRNTALQTPTDRSWNKALRTNPEHW